MARRLRATIRTGQEHAQIRATATRDLAAARAQAARLSDQRIRQAAVLRERAPAQFVGQLSLPAAGATLHAFGSASGDGPASGVTYATAPGSFVVSPCAGRVAFAAPFRSYGKLLIVACGGGSDVVLAGLGTLSASHGLVVRRGEPLGRMPQKSGKLEPANHQGGGLYVEVRIHGRPVNPVPFFVHPS